MHYTHIPTLSRFLSLAQSHYHTTRRSISKAPRRVTRCWHSCLNSKRVIRPCRFFFRGKNLWDDGMDYDLDYSERDSLGSFEAARDRVQSHFEDGERVVRARSEVPLLEQEEHDDGEGPDDGDDHGLGSTDMSGDDSNRLGADYNVFCQVEAMKAAYASQCYWGVMGREIVP